MHIDLHAFMRGRDLHPFSAKKSVNNLKYNTFANTSLLFSYSGYNSRRIEFTKENILALKTCIKKIDLYP